jgi:ubiquinone/menaquinone biosynthesis C-methylase UbiE
VSDPAPAARAQQDAAEAPAPADRKWFIEHYDDAAGQVVDFLQEADMPLAGRSVADVGCGDGIIDLGIAHKGRPARLVGFDICPTDVEELRKRAHRHGVADELPAELSFVTSSEIELPARNQSFDAVISWSAFEHVRRPAQVLAEIRRILRPTGVFFLQLWPFYYSERGSHLWDWFGDGFHHLTQSEVEIAAEMRRSARHSEQFTEYMLHEFRELNRITLDGLQAALLEAGLEVRRVELMSHLVNVPKGLAHVPLSQLAIAGVKLLAVPS